MTTAGEGRPWNDANRLEEDVRAVVTDYRRWVAAAVPAPPWERHRLPSCPWEREHFMLRVLVVDDEAIVRDGLRAIIDLEDDLEVVGEAADGVQALSAVRDHHPDVVLVDVQMPNMDGVELTRRLLELATPPRVIVLTTFDRNEYVYEAMRAGASGFLLKDVRRGQLTDAIRAVMRDDTLLAPSITRRLVEQFCRAPSPGGATPPQLADLTPREREVLTLVGRGLSNTEIAVKLFVAETTVKTHIARILTKLRVRDRAQAVVIAYETGLVRTGEAR
jgi:DNA-binding NarL/FixJ family response regulator